MDLQNNKRKLSYDVKKNKKSKQNTNIPQYSKVKCTLCNVDVVNFPQHKNSIKHKKNQIKENLKKLDDNINNPQQSNLNVPYVMYM